METTFKKALETAIDLCLLVEITDKNSYVILSCLSKECNYLLQFFSSETLNKKVTTDKTEIKIRIKLLEPILFRFYELTYTAEIIKLQDSFVKNYDLLTRAGRKRYCDDYDMSYIVNDENIIFYSNFNFKQEQ